MRNKKIPQYGLFLTGAVLILLAGILFLHNHLEDRNASRTAEKVLEQLHTELDDRRGKSAIRSDEPLDPQRNETKAELPDYMLNPRMEMPTTEINGDRYIGCLSFPSLDVELPVMSSWSDAGLKKAPCLYTGSVYRGNAVIAAHNYVCFFRQLFYLAPGDEVRFTDVDGNTFLYEIVAQEVLDATAIDEMISSDFDLSLFTCTFRGSSRFTVRCRSL